MSLSIAQAAFAAPARPLVHGRSRPARLAPAGAVARPREPTMRPLSPNDDAARLAETGWGQRSNEPAPQHSSTSGGVSSGTSSGSTTQLREDLVPMQYRGPQQPVTSQQVPVQRQQAGIGATLPASNTRNSAAQRVTVTASTNGAAPAAAASGSSGGAVLYGQRVPAAAMVQGAASAGATFQRSMMVAGFEEDDNELPTDYQYTWSQEDYSRRRRTLDTWSFVLTLRARLWLLDQAWTYPGGMTPEKKAERGRTLAVWIRETILQLGPTFIKLGQLFSTRSDLFPAEFTQELSKLQDRVPAFSADKAEAIIERELGAPVGVLFREFDRKPIAAASLGQVHRATLHSGEQVVVKVQRPGLRQLFEIDLQNLEKVAEQLDKGDEATRDFKGIYQECAKILYEEIDYINEGRNADRFRRNFRSEGWIRVPRVYWQYSSPAVLTLEYMPGVKITNTAGIAAAGLDAPRIAQRATESYLIQILRHGFFHADPHPGNIAIDGAGNLIFYDFGMMGEIVPATRERLLDLYYGIVKKDTDAVVSQLVALGIIVPTSDLLSIKRSINFFIQNINRQAQQQEAVSTIGEDLFAIALDQPFRFPAAFTFVLRAFATLEGIGKALDPGFKFVNVAAPYASELLNLQDSRSQTGFVLEQLQQQAVDLGQAAAAMPMRVQRIESTMALLETGDLKLRVRVLEAERAARRAGVIQAATIQSIGCMGFLNVGVQLGLAGQSAAAGAALAVSGVCAGFVVFGFRRVKRLDKFEKSIKTGTKYDPNS